MKKQDYDHAREEFRKDAEVEPDLGLDYEKLGDLYWLTQKDVDAEKCYQEALRRDPRLVNSHVGLAKLYQRQQKYSLALQEALAAEKIDPERSDVHYLHSRVLLQMGRKDEAKKEMNEAQRIERDHQNQVPGVPSPELLQDAQ